MLGEGLVLFAERSDGLNEGLVVLTTEVGEDGGGHKLGGSDGSGDIFAYWLDIKVELFL